MLRRPAHRLTITIFVVLSLLFSQLALANYVCPPAQSSEGEQRVMQMAPGAPCEGMRELPMDQGQPVLCHQHCVNAPQSFDPLHVPTVSLPAIVHAHVVPLPDVSGSGEAPAYGETGRPRPPPDPLFLSTLRLRV
jgi:hypothetical protein